MTLKNPFFSSLLFGFQCHRSLFALDLDAYPKYLRPGPDGKPVLADRSTGEPRGNLYTRPRTIRLRAARNGYVSFFLVVKESGQTPYSLSFRLGGRSAGIHSQLFKTWSGSPRWSTLGSWTCDAASVRKEADALSIGRCLDGFYRGLASRCTAHR